MLLKLKKLLTDIKDAFLEEFSSVKLAIVLFIFLALTTLIGTILPQEPTVGTAEILEKYGRQKYDFFKGFGLTDVFHSWWYLALLTTLGINLIVASFKKVFPRCYLAFLWPGELSEENIKRLPVYCELPVDKFISLNKVNSVLKRNHYTTRSLGEKIVAIRGSWHKLGASVTHVGIIILLLGSTISVVTGFNGIVQLKEKEGFYLVNLGRDENQIASSEPDTWLAQISKMPIWFGNIPPYYVKLNKTWRENYLTGEPKQWYSNLSVFDSKKQEVLRKTICVNDPLMVGSLDVYQSNWGRFVNVSFNNEQVVLPLEEINSDELVFLPLSNDIALKLKVAQDNDKLIIKAKNTKDENKRVNDSLEIYSILLTKNKRDIKEKYLGKIIKGNNLQVGPLNIGYFGANTVSGLQFKSNPGDLLIYPSVILIIIGVFIAFGSKRQIWAAQNLLEQKIFIGGISDRAKVFFNREFEKIIREITGSK